MARRRPTTPSNETVARVPVFTPDTAGAAMFAGITAGNSLGFTDQLRPVIDARGGRRYTGSLNGVQNFRGAGNVGGFSPVAPATTRLDQTAGSAVSTPVQSIFEQRMAARRFS